MSTDNFDKINKDSNLLERIEKLEAKVSSLARRNVRVERISNISPSLGELDFRAVDDNGMLRTIMSALNLFDEFGIDAHFAGLDADSNPQFYISSDDGSAVFAGGLARLDESGLTFGNNIAGLTFQSGDGGTKTFGGLDASSIFKLVTAKLGNSGNALNTNGTFETGDFTNWTETDAGAVLAISTDAHKGNYAAAWSGAGSATDGKLNFNSGSTLYYMVVFYAKKTGGAASVYVQDANHAGTIVECKVVGDGWNRYIAITDARWSSVDIWAGAGVVIDDVEIYSWIYGSSIEMDGNDMILRAANNVNSNGSLTLYTDAQIRIIDSYLGRTATLPAAGWLPWAMPIGVDHKMDFSTASRVLAANGGAVATAIIVDAPMMLRSVAIYQNSSGLTRTWNWAIYRQDTQTETPAENTLTQVAVGAGETFTAVPGKREVNVIANGVVYLPPGCYWIVIQNQHATNNFSLGTVTVAAGMGDTHQVKTLTNPFGSTLDFVAATWTKYPSYLGIRINGEVFGESTKF